MQVANQEKLHAEPRKNTLCIPQRSHTWQQITTGTVPTFVLERA
jgi:hypothetical protein